jgi:16S rRNA (adenine1518-N6/adenine1519-N6)-dimethyltransferase
VEIKAKKSLGQNFLIDKNIIEKISSVTKITNREILEVGPGTGNLTSSLLLKKPKKIFAFEKDQKLCSILLSKFNNQIENKNADILKSDLNQLSKDKLIVFGNLPYNISTEIICSWIINLKKEAWFDELILMFQKEVAERIISEENSSNYGRLTILCKWRLNVEKIFDISPNCFFPKPKVESSVLHFTLKHNYNHFNNPKNLELVSRIFFNQRRKMIKSPMKQLFENFLYVSKKLDLDLEMRPQNISLDQYFKIVNEYEKLGS